MTCVMSDRLVLPPRWASGRCPRDHDIINPDNVGHNVRQQFCLPCYQMRLRARRAGEPFRLQYTFPTKYCERCGTPWERKNESVQTWSQRRYCSLFCANRRRRGTAAAQPRPSSAPRSKKLSAAEIERLRRLVGFSAEWTA